MRKSNCAYLYFATLLLIFFIPDKVFSQADTFQFSITDEKTKMPIQFCYVVVKGKNVSSITDENGIVKINAVSHDTLVIHQLGYFLKKLTGHEIKQLNNIVLLQTKNINLDEVTITSKKFQIFQEKNNIVFLDFEFYDDFVVCLINKGNKYNALLLTDNNGNKILESPLKIKSEKLFKDCFDNVHLLTEDSVYQIYYDYQYLKILSPFHINNYYSILQPCECIYGDNYIFKVKQYRDLRNSYIFYDIKNDIRKTIICVADSDAIAGFNMDYDIRYFLELRKKGIGYFYSVATINEHIDRFREQLPLSSTYANLLRPTESEIKKIDSNFVLFDYTNKLVYHFSLNGELRFQTSLKSFSNLSPKLYIDRDADNYIFSNLNNRSGILTLYRYDKIKNSLTHRFVQNDFHYIKNFKVKENHLYFIKKNRTTEGVKTKIVKVYINWEKG